MSTATVVGSGPNGLACAVALAQAGVEVTVLEAAETIGGGTRSAELTLPGVIHDVCSAFHPGAVTSPFFRSLDLEEHGLEWCQPEIDLAHPLDDGSAATMVQSLERTVAGLGADGPAWQRLFGHSVANFDAVNAEIMRPLLHLPKHPILLTRFGLPAAAPATLLTRGWKTAAARALFGGVAAHTFSPLTRPFSAAGGVALIAAGHVGGWPVAGGGSQSIAAALVGVLARARRQDRDRRAGQRAGRARLPRRRCLRPRSRRRRRDRRRPPSARVARAYRRYRHGPGAFKVDLAVEGGVPWTAEACRRAGTVHVIGSFEELVIAERDINRGRMPARPFLLVGQQYLADPQRSAGDIHPIWAYAHVPSGYDGDGEKAVLDQIERFAPGLRERIVATSTRTPAELEAHNPNYVGGDIATGVNDPLQMTFRPRLTLDPYATGVPGLFICSAATPPGGGVHGMAGYNAAQSALRHLGAGNHG